MYQFVSTLFTDHCAKILWKKRKATAGLVVSHLATDQISTVQKSRCSDVLALSDFDVKHSSTKVKEKGFVPSLSINFELMYYIFSD